MHVLKSLIGSHVLASDGRIGNVRDFLFGDQSWKVRYLVVECGPRGSALGAVTSVRLVNCDLTPAGKGA